MLLPTRSQFEPHGRPLRLVTSSPLRHGRGSVALRIYTSRRRDRTWVGVLAGCLGVYLALAVGFHWFLQPTLVKNSEAAASKPATLVAYPDRRRTEPAFLRSSAQRSTARPQAPAGELARAETFEQAEQVGRPVKARTPKPPKAAAPRLGTNGGAYPGYSGNRPS